MEKESKKKDSWKTQMNWASFGMSSGFLFSFIIACLINRDVTYSIVKVCFDFVAGYFGGLLQVMLVVFWIIVMMIALSKCGKIRIGGKNAKKAVSTFSWYSIIIMTMTAAGGMFWAGAEPFVHFMSLPAHFPGIQSGTSEAVNYAMAQSFLHWGVLVWGASAFCIPLLVYAKEIKNLPMRPSSMLYPVLGEKGVRGVPGKVLDGLALIGVAAGTVGPTGFIGLQLSFVLHDLWGVPDTVATQMIVIAVAMVLFIFSACTGLHKGMDYLAKATVYLTVVLGAAMMIFGRGLFSVDSFITGYGIYITDFFKMAFSRADISWVSIWTVFYEAWFLSFGPSMAVLVITLSKGRTLREVLIGIAVMCPLFTNFWFAILGSPTIAVEIQNPGVISAAFNNFGVPSVLFTMLHHIPLSSIWIPIAIALVALHLVDTGAGVAYSMSTQVTNMDVPYVWVRAMFCVLLAAVAALLVWIGDDNAMNTLQSFMVIGGLPMLIFYIILIPGVYKAAKGLYRSKKHRLDPDDDFIEEEPVETVLAAAAEASPADNQTL
ncbi:BCCT family transporter [Acetonema longum]|uniref:Glycine/betane ABC transporter n=1 Tax=Acetonema longum DSM 6540 TaxID=1009370 RepID=F7NF18_9FIRM|nr:BCCT family transporter [Acetonema longum]EGO65579.1 glycine/betane ABC transporter [Acetonema longum DSM 6540]